VARGLIHNLNAFATAENPSSQQGDKKVRT
jgi:hypothetical protein